MQPGLPTPSITSGLIIPYAVGRNNRHCLCATCEVNKRGGYAPNSDEISDSGSSPDDSSSDNDASDWSTDREDTLPPKAVNINERRTRRGVYAVLPDEEDDTSDEDGEDDGKPTSLRRSRSPGPRQAGPSKDTGLLTPDSETLAAESCSASVTSTPRKATPATTTFIISTRAQKARAASELGSVSASGPRLEKGKARATSSRSASAVRQLETPPLTSDNGSVADGPSRRSSSRLRARGELAPTPRVNTPLPDLKGKTPASAQHSTADTADLKGKAKEDPETEGRILRRRPALPDQLVEAVSAMKKPQDGPRGVDGKLLPTCMTCKNVLPIISVEDKVVWNGAPEKTGKRGRPRKPVNQECPRCVVSIPSILVHAHRRIARCMRHYAIYAVRWPERTPLDGTPAFLPTPRDPRSSTPAYLSQKNLATLNHKLSNAAFNSVSASASASRSASAVRAPTLKRQRTEEAEPRPSKRQKVAPPPSGRPRGRPPKKNKVDMSTKARELLGMNERRSGRARVLTLKLRESEPPSKGRSASAPKTPVSSAPTSFADSSHTENSSSSLTPPQSSDAHGRHLRSAGNNPPAEPTTPVVVKTEPTGPKLPTPKSLAVASQPREANGRFGKKASTNGRYMRRNFHFTAGGRRMLRTKKVKPKSEGADGPVGEGASGDNGDPSSIHKRSLGEAEDDEDTEERGKRRKTDPDKVEVRVEVKIEGEEGDLSAAHEDEPGSGDEGEPQRYRRPALMGARSGPALFSRPNPLTFARRKWIPSAAPEDPPDIPEAPTLCSGQVSTDDDAELPVTPAEEVDQHVEVAEEPEEELEHDDGGESDDSTEPVYRRPKLSMKPRLAGALTFKPNPLNMARRRWGPPVPASADADGDSAESSLSKPSSHASLISLTDLSEAEPDDASLDRAHSEVSSEEVSPRALH